MTDMPIPGDRLILVSDLVGGPIIYAEVIGVRVRNERIDTDQALRASWTVQKDPAYD